MKRERERDRDMLQCMSSLPKYWTETIAQDSSWVSHMGCRVLMTWAITSWLWGCTVAARWNREHSQVWKPCTLISHVSVLCRIIIAAQKSLHCHTNLVRVVYWKEKIPILALSALLLLGLTPYSGLQRSIQPCSSSVSSLGPHSGVVHGHKKDVARNADYGCQREKLSTSHFLFWLFQNGILCSLPKDDFVVVITYQTGSRVYIMG